MTNSPEVGLKEPRKRSTDQEVSEGTDSEQESIEENEDEGEEQKEEQYNTQRTPRRAPGRPKIQRTGKKGRPRKLYRELISDEETANEPLSVEEIKNRNDKQL